MADSIATITRVSPPTSDYAYLGIIVGASTPAESILVWVFKGTETRYLDFHGVMSNDYTGRGVAIDLKTSVNDNTSDEQTRWEAAFRRVPDDAEDLDTTAHTYTSNGVSIDLPTAVGETSYDSIEFDDGDDMDRVAAGEHFILRIWRDHDHEDDDPTEDAYLHHLTIRER